MIHTYFFTNTLNTYITHTQKTYTLHTYQLAACFNKLEAVVFTTLAAHTDPHSTPHQNTNDVTLWIRGRHRRKTTEQHAGGDGGG